MSGEKVDREKIRQKFHFMRYNLKKLKTFQEMSLDEFKDNFVNEAAATRMLQVVIEAMLDTCAHIISREGWGLPKSYRETVEIVCRERLIPSDMEETYKEMVRFRNRVVHLYDEVNQEEIYNIVNTRLNDFHPFMKNMVQKYLDEDNHSP